MDRTPDNLNSPDASINRKNDIIMFITFIALAVNMRASFLGMGSLVPIIKLDLGINNTVAGMVSTLPLIMFMIMSPQAARISRRMGIGRALMLTLILILFGIIIRSLFGIVGLFAGTAILSAGLGVLNVLSLSFIKLRFPNRIGFITGVFSTAMAAAVALTIGISVPVASTLGLGWQTALGMWAIVAAICILLWYNRMKNEPLLAYKGNKDSDDKKYYKIVYKIPRVWCFAFYNGMQQIVFHAMNAWLPSIIESRGYPVDQAAAFAVYYQLLSLPATLVIPIIIARRKSQRSIMLIFGTLMSTGIIIFNFAHSTLTILLSLAMITIGLGAAYSFVNTFVTLRVDNVQQSAAVAGMIQTMGFLIAAIAPTIIGYMYDINHSWTMPIVFVFIASIMLMVLGMPLASDRKFFDKY